MKRRITSAVAGTALFTITAAIGSCSGRQISTAVHLSSYTATDEPASRYFCGNRRKQSAGAPCFSNALDPSGTRLAARERVEIRGWVIASVGDEWSFGDAVNAENVPEEYRFDLLLDHGWPPATPADANVFALNTAQRINAAISPHNAIHFGIGDGGIGSARLDADGRAWGGAGGIVIHVEVDAWFERGRMFPRCQSGGGLCAIDDWITIPEVPTNGLYWPFNPVSPPGARTGALQLGEYVRLVGTLWEDGAHIDTGGKGGDRGESAKSCWCRRATGNCRDSGRGWFELHPVDYMVRIEPPTTASATLEVLALCGDGSVTREIAPPGPRPSTAAAVGFEKHIDTAFSDLGTVSESVTVLPASIRVDVSANSGAGNNARFKAMYRVFWLDANGAPLPGSGRPPIPPREPLEILDVIEESCGASSLFIDTPRPRKILDRGQSIGFLSSTTTIQWSCGPRQPGQPYETMRCDSRSIAIKITRARSGDDVVTECIGPP